MTDLRKARQQAPQAAEEASAEEMEAMGYVFDDIVENEVFEKPIIVIRKPL